MSDVATVVDHYHPNILAFRSIPGAFSLNTLMMPLVSELWIGRGETLTDVLDEIRLGINYIRLTHQAEAPIHSVPTAD